MRLPLLATALVAALSLLLRPVPTPDHAARLAGHRDATFELANLARGTTPTTTAPTAAPTTAAPPPLTTAPPPTTAPAPPPPPDPLPVGQGMWIWLPDQVEGGDPNAIVTNAVNSGLTHLFVRTGSSWDGFYAQDFLSALLPIAHAAGLRVYGWDFPNLRDIATDINRGLEAIRFTTPTGDRIDGFSPDIETPSEGVALNSQTAWLYTSGLRNQISSTYPLIATVPRPNEHYLSFYPYQEVVYPMSAVAPMVYWMSDDPSAAVKVAYDNLAWLGKPIMPIGQAYDGGPEGGPPGNPGYDQIKSFTDTAAALGAPAVSFWSWQHASLDEWQAIQQSQSYAVAKVMPRGLQRITAPPP